MANFECSVHFFRGLWLILRTYRGLICNYFGRFFFLLSFVCTVLYQTVYSWHCFGFWQGRNKEYLVHGLKVVQSHVILVRGLAGTIDVDKGWIAMAPIRCQLLSLMMIQVLRPCSCILMGLGGHHVLWIFESRDLTLFTMATSCVITIN